LSESTTFDARELPFDPAAPLTPSGNLRRRRQDVGDLLEPGEVHGHVVGADLLHRAAHLAAELGEGGPVVRCRGLVANTGCHIETVGCRRGADRVR